MEQEFSIFNVKCIEILYIIEVLVTVVGVGLVAHYICGQAGHAAIAIGNDLTLSSTVVVLRENNFTCVFFL
ncbi:hypothetical protein GLYMA_03G014100v4 [Glycine max]|uniref:Uncharacterized protein n=1 Tax=Glycine max TaxID=3847 RepID=K7KC61_SOYBN|nr:hypothetical protein GLYMA_03G014100v4 [Glycine max]